MFCSIHGEDVKKEEKEFNKFLKNKGIDPDEDYHWLPEDKQKKLQDEFKKQQDKENDKKEKKVIVKKYYKDNDDNDDDDDVKDLAAYNMGYRNGKVDKINKMPFNDEFPFDDKDGKTWYKVGYRSGWDSGK
jgi:hypothetical protein